MSFACKNCSSGMLLSIFVFFLKVYQIQVTRPQVGMTALFRRYREFDELHCRLTLCFPGDELPGFPGKTYIPGKSRARETVERRSSELNKYISLLLRMEARISEVGFRTSWTSMPFSGRPELSVCLFRTSWTEYMPFQDVLNWVYAFFRTSWTKTNHFTM